MVTATDTMPRVHPTIARYEGLTQLLYLTDALRTHRRIRVEALKSDAGTGRVTERGVAWLPLEDLRVICHLVTSYQFLQVLPQGYRYQGGGRSGDGSLIARCLTLTYAGGYYVLTLRSGPGQETAGGRVEPAGLLTIQIALRLPARELVQTLAAAAAYLAAAFRDPLLLARRTGQPAGAVFNTLLALGLYRYCGVDLNQVIDVPAALADRFATDDHNPTLGRIVTRLNDELRWSREQIAAWLKEQGL